MLREQMKHAYPLVLTVSADYTKISKNCNNNKKLTVHERVAIVLRICSAVGILKAGNGFSV